MELKRKKREKNGGEKRELKRTKGKINGEKGIKK